MGQAYNSSSVYQYSNTLCTPEQVDIAFAAFGKIDYFRQIVEMAPTCYGYSPVPTVDVPTSKPTLATSKPTLVTSKPTLATSKPTVPTPKPLATSKPTLVTSK